MNEGSEGGVKEHYLIIYLLQGWVIKAVWRAGDTIQLRVIAWMKLCPEDGKTCRSVTNNMGALCSATSVDATNAANSLDTYVNSNWLTPTVDLKNHGLILVNVKEQQVRAALEMENIDDYQALIDKLESVSAQYPNRAGEYRVYTQDLLLHFDTN